MVLPEIRLLQAAIVVAEELHFSRAADRLHMTQSTLSKQILKLERIIGFQVFKHNHQAAELTDAGRVLISKMREVLAQLEHSILSSRAVLDGSVEVLNIGKSSYTDPFLVSTILSIQLPLFPNLKIKLWSNYSNQLAQQVVAGTLDLALITGVPHKPKLSLLNIADNPFYVLMLMDDELAVYREVRLSQMDGRNWALVGQHANAYLYDTIQTVAADRGAHPLDLYHFTSAEEAAFQGTPVSAGCAGWRRQGTPANSP